MNVAHYEIWTDGSCIKANSKNGRGECGAGYVVMDVDTGKIVHLHGEYIGVTTNNMAEFVAVELALEDHLMREIDGPIDVGIISDSKMVVESLAGNYNLKEKHLIEVKERIQKLEAKLKGEREYFWVRGHSGVELNEIADYLAYTAARG